MTYKNKRTQLKLHDLIFIVTRKNLLVFIGVFFALFQNHLYSADIIVNNNEMYVINGGDQVTVGSIYLGTVSGEHGTVVVTGMDSTLTVDTKGIGTIIGTGSLVVTDGGTVNMLGTGEICFNGPVLFDHSFLTQQSGTLLDVGNGRMDFDYGSVVFSTGTMNATGGVFFNNNSELHVLGSDGILHITGGDLIFGGESTLGVSIGHNGGPVVSGVIDSHGNFVDLNDNRLIVTPEYGYYAPIMNTTTIITNSGGISGTFGDARFLNSRFGTLDDVIYDPNEVKIQFTASTTPFSSFTQTINEHNVGKTWDSIHRQQLTNFLPFMEEIWNMNDADLRALYNDLSGEIHAETMTMPLAVPGKMAFDRVGWDSGTGHVIFGPQYRLAGVGSRRAAWFRPYYVGSEVDSDGNASRYSLDGYGFVGGIDQTLTGGKMATGVMLGYGRPTLKMRNDKAQLDDFILGAYLATRVANSFEFKIWGGYGYQYYDMQRHVNLPGTPRTFKSNFKGSTGTVSAELTRPIYTMSRLVLKPVVGYDGLYLTQNAGDETGDSLVALSYHKMNIQRHIGRIGLNLEYGDSARSLYGGAQYKYLLCGDQVYCSEASYIGGGPSFVVNGVDPGKGFISANIGMQINLSDDRSRLFFVDYTADFGNHNALRQLATVGLQQTF